jgi:hypothetical protein
VLVIGDAADAVSPMQDRVREPMMRLMLKLFGKDADDWV